MKEQKAAKCGVEITMNWLANFHDGMKRVIYPARRAAWTGRAFPTDMRNVFYIRWISDLDII
jgi:hypothetical protein